MNGLITNRNQLTYIGSDNALALRTNGKSIEVLARGESAKVLTNVLAICLIAVTVKAVLS